MRLARAALIVLVTGVLSAQQPPVQRAPSPAARELRHRFGLVATRAIAYFRSADSIDENLEESGMGLHPDLLALKLQLEFTLDQTEAALRNDDLAAATKALNRAQALLDRFASKLGG